MCLFLNPGQVVTVNNRTGKYIELVDWKWPTSEGFVICVQKWMAQWRRKKYWQALVLWQAVILFVPDVQFWKRKLFSIRKRSVGSEDQGVN